MRGAGGATPQVRMFPKESNVKGPISSIALTLFAFVFSGVAAAETPAAVDGELQVTLKNAEYVKVQVNGEDYENIEFEKNGKVVLIKGLSLTLDHNAITLLPTEGSGLKQADLSVEPKEFKKQRKGREVFLVAKKTVAFDKSSEADPAPKTPEAPKPDPIGPPPDKKDDL